MHKMRSPIEILKGVYYSLVANDSRRTIEYSHEAEDRINEVIGKLNAPNSIPEITRRALIVYSNIADLYSPGKKIRIWIGNQVWDATHWFSDFEPEDQGPVPRQTHQPRRSKEPIEKIVRLADWRTKNDL